jgi:hypothetical protein
MDQPTDPMTRAEEAYLRGEKDTARQLLDRITLQEPENERAWLLLADVVDTPTERIDCLKQVLVLNPNNDDVAVSLELARRKQDAGLLPRLSLPRRSQRKFHASLPDAFAWVLTPLNFCLSFEQFRWAGAALVPAAFILLSFWTLPGITGLLVISVFILLFGLGIASAVLVKELPDQIGFGEPLFSNLVCVLAYLIELAFVIYTLLYSLRLR